MLITFFKTLFGLGMIATGAFLFLSLMASTEAGFRLGRLISTGEAAKSRDSSAISTLAAGMVGLLAFTLSLSINFAQNRYETRRGLVLSEATAIQTAWLRTKLIDGDEAPLLAAKVEDYARVRLGFTEARSESDVPALIARADALETEIWNLTNTVAHRTPNTVTTALVNALNDMFVRSTSQRFAFESRVPAEILFALYFGSILAIGALGYQFGIAGNRHMVLSSLLLVMWAGGMLLIVDLNQPRAGQIQADSSPLIWTIQRFQ